MPSSLLVAILVFVGASFGQPPEGFDLGPRILINPPDITEPCPKVLQGVAFLSPDRKNRTYSYLSTADLRNNKSRLSIVGCPDDDPLGRPVLRKCCPMDVVVEGSDGSKCVKNVSRLPFGPSVVRDNGSLWAVDPMDHFVFVFWRTCDKVVDPGKSPANAFALRGSDGRLSLPGWNGTLLIPGDFCLDYVAEKAAYLPFLCDIGSSVVGGATPLAQVLYPVALLISAPFLLATFVVHAFIRELRNIHGKNLMCLVGSYFVSFLLLALGLLGLDSLSLKLCIASAFITEYSFLAAFFWLNVICFDIFLTFSGIRPMQGSTARGNHKKFVFYSLYAWGVPFIIFILSVTLEYAPGVPKYIIKPEFGVTKCWFNSIKALAAYFYGPIAVILLSNLIMFIWTAVSLWKLKRETSMLRRDASRRHAENDTDEKRKRLILYLKLLIIMGINWIMEVIQTVVKGPEYIWVLCDLLNALQGVFIFFIFVWKKKIRNLVWQKLCQMFPDILSSDGDMFNSMPPWKRENASGDPTLSEMALGGQTLSTQLQSTGTKESEELSTLTTDVK